MIKDILSHWQDWQLAELEPRRENLKPLPGGLTNRCFLLPLDTGLYVLRIHGQNSRALDIDREAEFRIQRLVAARGLAPAVRYRSQDGHYWIRDYAQGKTLSSQDLSLPLLKAMASHLASLHALPLPDDVPRLSVADKASHYWNMIAAQPDMVSTKPRPITPLPLQAGLDGQPLQSVQAGHDTAMTLKPEQDLFHSRLVHEDCFSFCSLNR